MGSLCWRTEFPARRIFGQPLLAGKSFHSGGFLVAFAGGQGFQQGGFFGSLCWRTRVFSKAVFLILLADRVFSKADLVAFAGGQSFQQGGFLGSL